MAKTPTAPFTQNAANAAQTFVAADATTTKQLMAAGANDSKVTAIMVSSTDTANKDMLLYYNDGATDYLIGTASIPLNSGNTNAISNVNLLGNANFNHLPLDANGNRFLNLKTGWKLRAAMGAAVTAAKTIAVVVHAEDF